jgi:hypothetical protein
MSAKTSETLLTITKLLEQLDAPEDLNVIGRALKARHADVQREAMHKNAMGGMRKGSEVSIRIKRRGYVRMLDGIVESVTPTKILVKTSEGMWRCSPSLVTLKNKAA